jgi:hypothetical protein
VKKIYCRPFCYTIHIEAMNLLAVSPILPAINEPQYGVDGDARIVDFGDN